MESSDVAILISERIRLTSLSTDFGNDSGLGDYIYTKREEFWSEVTEFVLSSNTGAEAILNASPKLYELLSNYYSVDYGLTP